MVVFMEHHQRLAHYKINVSALCHVYYQFLPIK